MKRVDVITIQQPYAELLMLGVKTFLMRHWKTTFKGELYIHASDVRDWGALDLCNDDELLRKAIPDRTKLQFGMLIGKVDVVGVTRWQPGAEYNQSVCEYHGATYRGFAWKVENPVRIQPMRIPGGHPGIWEFEMQEAGKYEFSQPSTSRPITMRDRLTQSVMEDVSLTEFAEKYLPYPEQQFELLTAVVNLLERVIETEREREEVRHVR